MGGPPGAVILGNEYQGLGLLRQLRSSGIQCTLVDQDKFGVARFSKYQCKFHHSPPYTSDEFWPWLRRLADDYGYRGWIIYPTDDEQVCQLAMNYNDVLQVYKYIGPSWDTYRHLYNKRLGYAWALNLGISVPRTFIPFNKENIDACDLSYPFIVKPAIKKNYYKYTNKKAIEVNSKAQLKRLLLTGLKYVPIEELLYQEIIPGGGENQWSYAGFFINGEAIAACTVCRQRQHPPDYGRASTFVKAIYNEEVEKEGNKIIKNLNYTGLGEIEWKRDPRDNILKFFELNARCWGWQSIFPRVVGNIAKFLYDYAVDQKICQNDGVKYGVSWVKWVTDIPASLHLMARSDLRLKDYLQSVSKNTVWCEWDQGDPFPLILEAILIPYLVVKRGY